MLQRLSSSKNLQTLISSNGASVINHVKNTEGLEDDPDDLGNNEEEEE